MDTNKIIRDSFYLFEKTKDKIDELTIKALEKGMFRDSESFLSYVQKRVSEEVIKDYLDIEDALNNIRNILDAIENEIEMYGKILN